MNQGSVGDGARVHRQLVHRQALQIVNELPDSLEAALAVLERAKYLLLQWEDHPDADGPQGKPKLSVVS